jgi:hypothetical protein
MADGGKRWSAELRERTREALDELAMVPRDEFVYMKNIDGRLGVIRIEDWLARQFIVLVRAFPGDATFMAGEEAFASVDELICAGWAID